MPTGLPELHIPNSLITDYHRSVSPASNASSLAKAILPSHASKGGPVQTQMQTTGAYPQPPFHSNGAAYLSAPPHDPRQSGYSYPPQAGHVAYPTSQNGGQQLHPSASPSPHMNMHSRLAYEGQSRPGPSRRDSYQNGQFSGRAEQSPHGSSSAAHHAYSPSGQAYANSHLGHPPFALSHSPHPLPPQHMSTPTAASYTIPPANGQSRGSQTPQPATTSRTIPLNGKTAATQTPNGLPDLSMQADTPTKQPIKKKRGRPPGSASQRRSTIGSVDSIGSVAPGPSTPGSAAEAQAQAPSRPSKRQRIAPPDVETASVRSTNSQLITPPSTSSLLAGSDEEPMNVDLALAEARPDHPGNGAKGGHAEAASSEPATSTLAEATAARGTLSITEDDKQGRRIEFSQPQASTAPINPAPPRSVPTLVLVSNEKGEASVNHGHMLESEVAPVAGPSQPPPIMITPPPTAAQKLPLVSLMRPDEAQAGSSSSQPRNFDFGQFRSDGTAVGVAKLPEVGRVLTIPSDRSNPLKPAWPDRDSPFASDSDWALGGKRKSILASKNKQRAAMLQRYCRSDSDNSENEGSSTHLADRKGKGPVRNYQGPIHQEWVSEASSDAVIAATYAFRNRPLRIAAPDYFDCHCGQAQSSEGYDQDWIKCANCLVHSHMSCYEPEEIPRQGSRNPFYCRPCREKAAAMAATPVQQTRGYVQSDLRSSAFKNQGTENIALAPSPQFTSFERGASNARTPLSRAIASASSPIRAQSARQLSYNVNDFLTFPDAGEGPETPTAPSRGAVKPDDFAFDVNSTPSRHIPIMSSGPFLTPHWDSSRHISFAASPRVQLGYGAAPSASASAAATAGSSAGPLSTNLDFSSPAGPSRAHRAVGGGLLVSPSPFGHRRRSSGGNRMSSLRSSSLGAGLASAFGDELIEEDEQDDQAESSTKQ